MIDFRAVFESAQPDPLPAATVGGERVSLILFEGVANNAAIAAPGLSN